MALRNQTRKSHHRIDPLSKTCHPRVNSRTGECLPPTVLNELVSPLMPHNSRVQGQGLRNWMTRRTRCKSERCWLEKIPMDGGKKRDLLKQYFRPTMPDSWENDPDEWLDSNNISDVMVQYEDIYPGFKFYGANPIDFAAPDPYDKDAASKHKCLEDAICKLNLNELKTQDKSKLGFVYNLDPSNKGGSHWIASFTDIPGHRTYYFDSYGMKPPEQIARFMRSLTLQDPRMKLKYNSRRFQFGNSECGMYCLYFLIQMLKGENFQHFCRRAPRDSKMLELRQMLFSNKHE